MFRIMRQLLLLELQQLLTDFFLTPKYNFTTHSLIYASLIAPGIQAKAKSGSTKHQSKVLGCETIKISQDFHGEPMICFQVFLSARATI